MSQAAQAVRPKPAAPAPETRALRKHPHARMLAGAPRYLRANVRVGGIHDPEEHEADRAAGAIAAGGRHRVHDPGGARSLRAAAAAHEPVRLAMATNAETPVRRTETRAAAAPAVVDPGAEGRIRRDAAPAEPGPAAPLRAMAQAVVDPGGEGRIRRHIDHKAVDPGGTHSLRAMASAEPARPQPQESVRATAQQEPTRADTRDPVRGEDGPLRRVAAGATHGRESPRHAHRDADAEAAECIERARTGHGHPLPPSLRARLEHGFGESMGGVRIDTSDAGRTAAAAIGARAYTEGERITLGHGESEHDLRLMAHEATHVVQNRRRADRCGGTEAQRNEIRRREVHPAEDAGADDDRHYRMHDGRVIELPDDMTRADAAKLEADGEAAKRRLGKGPPPKPVPDVHKPPDLSKAKKPPPKLPPKHRHVHGQHPGGPHSAGAVAKLRPVGGPVGHYLTAKAAPALSRGIAKLAMLSWHEQTHKDAGTKVAQAEKAVVIPHSESQSKSNTSQVRTVSGRPAPPIDPGKAENKLQESLAENVPRTIEDVDQFKRDRKAQHTGAEVLKVVQADKNSVVTTFADMEHTPPPVPPEHAAEPLPPIEAAPPTAAMNLGQGAVPPLMPEHTDVSNYTKEADGRLKEEGVTQEQLDMVDSGDLAAANKEKKGLEKAAKTEPQAVRNFARDETAEVDTALKHEEKAERGALAAHHKHGLGHTAAQQKHAKTKLEKKRDEVAAKINGIYQTAQDSVKKKLADLETQAMKRFDDGNAKASKDFEDTVNRELDAYKDDRYSGVFGWARKAKDWLLGMDDLPEVKAIFERNRQAFVDTLNRLVADISADNKRVVQECKDELTKAKADIKEYVDKLGPELKDIANKTAKEVDGKLNELDGFIRKKEVELQKKLADKQQKAIQAIDDKIAKMKEAMSGALAKLGQLLLWAAKKFFKWALEQFGYSWSDIEAIIDRGVAILKAIVTKPIQFVKNLIAAAKQGFLNFGKNFLTHLKDALFDWLTGSLEGLQLPETWDLKGIASVALQMLGLTWANIRSKLVKRIGETPVKAMETGFDLVVTLVRDGPMAAWEKLQDMGSAIKEAFVAAVKDFIVTKIITEAIKTVIAIFVPGAGIVKAIIAIYDTIVFFIQKAKQILEMIGNFLSAIGEIASGNIQLGADALEKGLATALKLVINFLARFLHLDAITAKIRNAIQKIRDKVDGALEKVVDWVVDKGKAVLAKLTGAAKRGAAAVVSWWKEKLGFTNKGGENHTLQFIGTGDSAQLGIATTLQPVRTYLDNHPDKGSDTWNTANSVFEHEMKLAFTPAAKDQAEKDRRAGIKIALAKISQAFAGLAGAEPTAGDYGKSTEPTYGNPAEVEAIVGDPWPGSVTGAWPTTETQYKYDQIYAAGLTTATDKWVQMHIISEKLGGSGTNPDNLIPAPGSVNTGPFRSFELATAALARAKSGKIKNRVWVSVFVTGKAATPTLISGKSGLHLWVGKAGAPATKGWLKSEQPSFTATARIPVPQLGDTRKLVLNFTSGTEMQRGFGISSVTATLVKQGRPYDSEEHFVQDMFDRGATKAQVNAVLRHKPVLDGP